MTVNKFLDAIGLKLMALWPGKKVYVDEIPQGADGNFFVQVVDVSQKKQLGNRHKRVYEFDVAFILKKHDTLASYSFIDTMLMEFDTIQVDGMSFRTTDMHTDEVDRIVHCLFTVSYSALIVPVDPGEPMEQLKVLTGLNISSYQNIHIIGSVSLGSDGQSLMYQVPECGPNKTGGI